MQFFISDLHFYHESLLTKMDKRGFASCEEMHEYIIGKWNGKVRPQDEVVILGDTSMERGKLTSDILDRLNGRLYLVVGNHDNYLRDRRFDASRFEWVKDYAVLHDNKRKIVLSHYPIMCYNGQYRLDEEGNPKTYMLYGHVHDTQDQRLLEQFQEITRNTKTINAKGEAQSIPCNMINCFCMYSDYEPLTLDEWIALDKKRRN